MTSVDITSAVVGFGSNCLWNPRKVLAARNCVGVCGWDADLLIVHPSGWAWEIEIKISASDFRREFTSSSKQTKHRLMLEGRHGTGHAKGKVRQYLFAMPTDVYSKVHSEIPDYAGIILLDSLHCDHVGRMVPRIERKGRDLPATKLEQADRERVLTSVYYGFWNGAFKHDHEELLSRFKRGAA